MYLYTNSQLFYRSSYDLTYIHELILIKVKGKITEKNEREFVPSESYNLL